MLSKISGMEAIEDLDLSMPRTVISAVIPSAARDLAWPSSSHSSARSLAALGMTVTVRNGPADLPRGVPMRCRVPPGREVLELALDVGQQRARAEPEQVGTEPAIA